MAFKFEYAADYFRGSLEDSLGKPIYSYAWACYAGVFHKTVLNHLQNPEVKSYVVYWSDAVSFVDKNRKSTEKALQLLSTTDIFRNTDVKLIEEKDIPADAMKEFNSKKSGSYDYMHEAPYWIRLSHDVEKCTGEEMFLSGSIVRTFALYPEVVKRFLKLHSKYGKKYDISHLFIIAHSLTWTKEEISLVGHRLVQSSFSVLTGKTFTNFLEDLDKDPVAFKPIRTSKNYLGKRVESYLTKVITNLDKYGRYGSSVCRWGGTLFSRNIIKTYFDEKYFLKIFNKDKSLISINSKT